MITRRRSVRLKFASPEVERPTLVQFVVLSMLLHLLVILLFGSTTQSGARRGEGLFGPLQLNLRRLTPDAGSGFRLAPGVDAAAAGAALLRRLTGATRPPVPASNTGEQPTSPAPAQHAIDSTERSSTPPDAAAPENAATPAQEAPAASDTATSAPPPAPPISATPVPTPPQRIESLPPLNRNAPQEVDRLFAPATLPPLTIERQVAPSVELRQLEVPAAPAPPEPIIAPNLQRQVAPAVDLKRLEVPVAPTPLEPIITPKLERQVAPPVELKRLELPVVPAPLEPIITPKLERQSAPPVELKRLEVPVAPTPLEPIITPQLERQAAPPVELKRLEVPVAPTPLEPIITPQLERQAAPPVELKRLEVPIAPTPLEPIITPKLERQVAPPVELKQMEVPVAPTAPLERVAPSPPTLAPPVAAPSPPTAPAEISTPVERGAPTAERPTVPGSELAPRTVPSENAPRVERATPSPAVPTTSIPNPLPAGQGPARADTPTGTAPQRLFSGPDPGDEIFKPRRDVVTPASEPGGTPHIDLEAARKRAREIAKEGSYGVVSVLPPPPPLPRKDTLAAGIAKAWKPDCRLAYADLGLLAVAPLLVSTLGNGGCRW